MNLNTETLEDFCEGIDIYKLDDPMSNIAVCAMKKKFEELEARLKELEAKNKNLKVKINEVEAKNEKLKAINKELEATNKKLRPTWCTHYSPPWLP